MKGARTAKRKKSIITELWCNEHIIISIDNRCSFYNLLQHVIIVQHQMLVTRKECSIEKINAVLFIKYLKLVIHKPSGDKVYGKVIKTK